MKKSTKNILILSVIILSITTISILSYFIFISQSAVSPILTKGFTQYESTACGTYQCPYIYGKLTTSNTAEFDTGTNKWKIITSGGSWGSCGADAQGYIIGGCCATTQVYRNGNLIDTIRQGYGGTSSSLNTAYDVRVYCDDGTFDNCNNKIAIGVYPKRWGSTVNNECNNRQNDFTVVIPNGTFRIDTTPSNTAYSFGDTIFFQVKVTDNLFATKGKIRILYEAPSLFGKVTKTEEKEVDLVNGQNLFNFTLPISEQTSSVTINPELIVYYRTSAVSGVNYNFGAGQLEPISSHDYFDLADFKDAPITLNITQGSSTTCKTVGCPSGYNCADNGMCEKPTNYLMWIIISAVLLVIIIILVVLLVKRK